MPRIARPLLMLSRVLKFFASCTALRIGKTITETPRRSRSVTAAA
jgi:hypothetical protein